LNDWNGLNVLNDLLFQPFKQFALFKPL